MKKLPVEKRNKILAIAGGTLAGCVAFWFLVISAQNAAIKKHGTTLDDLKQQVGNSHRLLKQAGKIEAELEAVTGRVRQVEETMAQGDMYSWVIKTMNKFLANHRVDIPTFTPPGVGEVGIMPQFPYKAATFAIRGTAYFHDFGAFVADFENSFPCARLQNLDLEPLGILSAKPEDAEKVSFRLEIVTLIKPNAAL